MNSQNFSNWIEIEDGELVTFSDLPQMIGKALFPADENGFACGGARINLEKELPDAVRNGELIVRNALTRGVHDFPHGDALQRAVILPHDLRPFLAKRGIGLRVIPSATPAATLPISTRQAARASEPLELAAVPTVRHKLRTNSLDAPIKKAIKRAGSIETGAVYLELRALALDCENPFTGAFEGDGLFYTKDDNVTVGKLTKDALGKRLKRHTL